MLRMTLRRLPVLAALALAAWLAAPSLAWAGPKCLCRYAGQYFKLGQCVCIKIGSRERMACCGRILNNTSWSFKAGGCKYALDQGGSALPQTKAPKGALSLALGSAPATK